MTFDQIYPVGSIYISVNNVKPPLGTWKKLATGVTLWNDPSPNGRTIAAGLPNITGAAKGDTFNHKDRGAAIYWEGTNAISTYVENISGAFASYKGDNAYATRSVIDFNASRSNAIYGRSSTVQPPAIAVSMWRHTA